MLLTVLVNEPIILVLTSFKAVIIFIKDLFISWNSDRIENYVPTMFNRVLISKILITIHNQLFKNCNL